MGNYGNLKHLQFILKSNFVRSNAWQIATEHEQFSRVAEISFKNAKLLSNQVSF